MRVLIVLGLVLFAALPLLPAEEGKPGKIRVYVGTYTGKSSSGHRSEGIYRTDLDLATGQLSEPTLAGKAVNPSFLAIHPTGKYLYACGEVATFAGKKGVGSISAFAIDDRGDLAALNQQSSEGAGPCHVVLDKAGRYAFCANYGGGSAAALPIGPDGKLGKATGFVQHRGSSVNKDRQAGPHAHSINLDAANKYAFVADLGLDKVLIYKFDADKGTLTPNDPAEVKLAPGAGPRHFAFHPNGKNAYVINEMDMTVSAMAYDPATGKLEVIQTVPTKDKVEKGDSTAEVVVHPSGKFVYGSNRGDNRIAVFRCDPATGKLTPAGHQGQGVKTPRNFALDPTGAYCLVANQDGDSVVVFKVNPETGALEPTDHKAQVASPVCVRMMSVR